jgi:EEF1A lysine methyltransferase 2
LPTSSWNALYTTELSNHASNPSDTGTVWFDDSDAEAKLLHFLAKLAGFDSNSDSGGEEGGEDEEGQRNRDDAGIRLRRESTSFLDLGCGNGSLLFALRDEGWQGRMLGVDYSPQSISLAKQIAAQRDEDAPSVQVVEFQEWDVLAGSYAPILSSPVISSPNPTRQPIQESAYGAGWDVVLDKGTFDAICLSEDLDPQGRRICEGYKARVLPLLREGGLFVVTSCNWTEEELRVWFEEKGDGEVLQSEDRGEAQQGVAHQQQGGTTGGLMLVGRVEYPSFSFGGVKGQTISTLCFQKVVKLGTWGLGVLAA